MSGREGRNLWGRQGLLVFDRLLAAGGERGAARQSATANNAATSTASAGTSAEAAIAPSPKLPCSR